MVMCLIPVTCNLGMPKIFLVARFCSRRVHQLDRNYFQQNIAKRIDIQEYKTETLNKLDRPGEPLFNRGLWQTGRDASDTFKTFTGETTAPSGPAPHCSVQRAEKSRSHGSANSRPAASTIPDSLRSTPLAGSWEYHLHRGWKKSGTSKALPGGGISDPEATTGAGRATTGSWGGCRAAGWRR